MLEAVYLRLVYGAKYRQRNTCWVQKGKKGKVHPITGREGPERE